MADLADAVTASETAQAQAAAVAETITQLVHDARLTNYLMAMALSLLIFEFIITISDEIELIWKKRMRFTSYLYLWNRYISLIGILISASFMLREMKDDNECVRYLQTEGAFASVITVSVDLVLVYRIWILYSKSQWVLYFLSGLVFCEAVVIFTLVIITLNSIESFVHIGPVLTGCYPAVPLPSFFKYYVITMLIVSVIMFGFTVYNGAIMLMRYNFQGMPVIRLFLRDGLFWFVAVLAFTVAQVAVLTSARVTLSEMMIAPTVAVYGTIGSRVVLNIRSMLFRSEPDYAKDPLASYEMRNTNTVTRIHVARDQLTFVDEIDDGDESTTLELDQNGSRSLREDSGLENGKMERRPGTGKPGTGTRNRSVIVKFPQNTEADKVVKR